MPFNGSGIYNPPVPPVFPAVAGTKIKSADFNSIINDIGTALTNCVTRDGQSSLTNDFNAGGYKLRSVDSAILDDDAATFLQVKKQSRGLYAAVAVTNVDVNLTATQYNAKILRVTGILTANVNLIFPAEAGEWVIINATTGAFSLSCKNSSGAAIAVTQGKPSIIFSDGTDFFSTLAEYTTLAGLFAPLNQLPTGTLLYVHDDTAPAGTVEARRDYTLGSAASGATYPNANTAALYALMWKSSANAVYTSSGAPTAKGASAAADFAANKRCEITEMRAEFVRGHDRSRGVNAGQALYAFAADTLKDHTHQFYASTTSNGEYTGPDGERLDGYRERSYTTSGPSTGAAFETAPRSVAHLACYKL